MSGNLGRIPEVGELERRLQVAIKEYISKLVDEAVEQVKKDLDARRPEIAATISTRIASYFDAMGADTVIQIRVGSALR